jgi:cysteine synthase A
MSHPFPRAFPTGGRLIRQVPPTPLVPVELEPALGPVFCKLEFMNPSGSTKDRIARHILEKAWRRGELKEGDTVVEASSGSTSIALALACAQMGLRFVAFIPDSASTERGLMIRAYGGEVRRVEGGMQQVLDAAMEAAARNRWFAPRQFENPDNSQAHQRITGPEILSQMECGCIDVVVSGVGTGGTLCGLWAAFHEAACDVTAIAAIPCEGDTFGSNAECCSVTFSKEVPGVIECLSKLYEDWKAECPEGRLEEVLIDERECLELTRRLWRQGFPVGPSSGLNYAAALEAKRRHGPEARVVTVFPDRMERYFSHHVFQHLREDAG